MNLLILGAGQYGIVTKEVAQATEAFDRIEFLDDNAPFAVGKIDDLEGLHGQFDCAVVAIGNAALRMSLLERLAAAGYRLPSLVHPRAYLSPSASVGAGSVVEPLAGIHAGVTVGRGCLVSMGALVNHNATVEDACHIDVGAVVAARATVSAGTKVWANTLFPVN